MLKIFFVILFFLSSLFASKSVKNIYDFDVFDIDNKKISLSKYKNKVLLIVNVASKCTFTSQYEGLEKLYTLYKNEAFMVLAFPSNDFGKQEPGSNDEIKSFCSINYAVDFDLFSKITVNGENTNALYKYLKNEARGIFSTKSIKWNFTKFLINKNGKVIKRYSPYIKPFSIEEDIQKLLADKLIK